MLCHYGMCVSSSEATSSCLPSQPTHNAPTFQETWFAHSEFLSCHSSWVGTWKMFTQQSHHKTIGDHHPPFQPATVCWIIRLPMGKSIKKAHPCPSSISGLRIFGHHQNKGRFFSEGNNISRYLEYWNTSFTMSMSKTKPCWITRTVVLWISCAFFWDSWCQRRKHLLNDLWNTRSRV